MDLYSGVGSFGIESISRGADHVTFLEKDISAAKTLNENLIQLDTRLLKNYYQSIGYKDVEITGERIL